jgi:hypothetical protein
MCFSSIEVYDGTFDAMLTGIYGFGVEIEKCLFSMLNRVILSEVDMGHWDESSLDSLQLSADLDSHLFKRAKIFISF